MVETINVRKMDETESDLRKIRDELHQMNVFLGHICRIFDILALEPTSKTENSSEKLTV